ncbi:MAG: 4Fe-4S binding protein [Oscillospiraceae bacterium]|nr:4Fe-4S binding protein [Oscillospiraceae bacterium]
MKVTAVYFSPTGGSRRYALAMAQALDKNYDELDLTPLAENYPARRFAGGELVILAAPVYGGRIPKLAVPRFSVLSSDGAACILVACYGNRHYDDALAELEDIAVSHGFTVIGGCAVVGRHTYGAVAVDRPDEDDLRQARAFAVKALKNSRPFPMPGNRPYRDGGDGGGFYPATGDNCVKCGKCRDLCPAGAIDGSFHVLADRCIACFRCVRLCPVGAKQPDSDKYSPFAEKFSAMLSSRRENEFFI